ncbi:hypothetical protein ACIQWN_37110 [Streptomyces vinaceus]|uniref:hypothetical protein n=1 Tax=Streptomyces vinaceus TaxID=1960 RepID=UPI0037FAFC3E
MPPYVPPAGLAAAADLNRGWVTKAADLGLVNLSTLDGEDLIVVRVFAFVDQLVWPGERRSRSVPRGMEPWQSMAVNAARDAARSTVTSMESILWVRRDGVEATHSPGEHAAYAVGAGGKRAAFAAVPIGQWIAELPERLKTVFDWPRPLESSHLALPGTGDVQLTTFTTVARQVTVFAVAPTALALDAYGYERIRAHVGRRHPRNHVRVVELCAADGSPHMRWRELYGLPDGELARRPLDYKTLLAQYGPQLRQLTSRPSAIAGQYRRGDS